MPRRAREQGSSRIYHVMLRGNERKQIFHDDDDRNRFLYTLDKMRENKEYLLYAYCLMDNHVHLLISEDEDDISRSMKRIGVSYAYYFNKKYCRVGHLFQDRYRSEVIDGESYLLMAARYIHNNPVKAGIVDKASDYKWSSYRSYLKCDKNNKDIVEMSLILSIFLEKEARAIELLKEYTDDNCEDKFIECENNTDKPKLQEVNSDIKGKVNDILIKWGFSLERFKECKDKAMRNSLIREMKIEIGGSVREFSKILGISKDIIFRA